MGMPAWASDPASLTLTEDQYDSLPDHARALVEVIDGHVIFCHRGTAEHSDVARRLASRLEAARPAGPRTRVSAGVDVRFARSEGTGGTFCVRRPDVAVYRDLGRGSKLLARDALLVAEVVSPGSGYTDTVDKPAEYACEGIPVYLVVFLDGDCCVQSVHEYRLDRASRAYRLAYTHEGEVTVEDPFPATVAFSELDG